MKDKIAALCNALIDGCISFLILFVPVFFVYAKGKHYYFSIYDIYKEVSIQTIAMVLLGLFLIKLFAEEKVRIKYSPLLWPFIFFFVAVFLSVLQAYNLHEAWIFVKRLGCNGIIVFILYNSITERKQLKRYINYLIFIGSFVSLYGIFQHFKVDFKELHQNFVGNSFFGNPNFASEFILVVFPLALLLLFADVSLGGLVFYFVTALIMFVFLVLNKSRAVWIGGVIASVSLITYLLVNYVRGKITFNGDKKQRKHALFVLKVFASLAIVFCILIGASFLPFTQKIAPLLTVRNMARRVVQEVATLKSLNLAKGEIIRGDTATQRILIWRNSLNMIRHNSILGVGVGNYKIQYQPYRTADEQLSTGPDIFVRRAHNEYVQLLSEIGLFGIVFFFWIIVVSLRMCAEILKKTKSVYGQFLSLGLMLSLLSSYISIFFNFSLQTPTPGMAIFLALGFLMFSYDEFLKKEDTSVICTNLVLNLKKTLRIGLIPLALFCFITPFWLVRPAIAFYNYQFGQACEKMGLRKDARAKLEKSLEDYYPSWETHFVLANVYASLSEVTKAKWHHEYALKLNPYHQKGHYNLANTLYKLGEVDRAIDHYKKGIEIDSIFYQSYNNLGSILYKENRLDESLDYFRKVTELEPNYFSGQYNMGYILSLLSRYNEAIPYAEKAVGLEPGNPKARRLLDELLRLTQGFPQ
jgi:tetratricopeptide (TPR) repeat protein